VCIFRSLVPLLGLCLVLAPCGTAEDRVRELPVGVTAAALDLETGNVAIANAVGNHVWILPAAWFDNPSVEPLGPLALTNPVSLLFKRHE